MRGDSDLLEAWSRGDREAADTLMRRYESRLRRFFGSKTLDATEDLIQATLLGCVEGRDRFRGDAQFSTFMFAVARKKLFEHYRRMQRVDRRDPVGESSVIDLGPSPSSILARDAAQERLLLALNELPLDAQITLELYYWENMKAREMAEVLGVKEAGIRSRLRRAKEQLRLRLDAGPRASGETPDSLEAWAESVRHLFDEIHAAAPA